MGFDAKGLEDYVDVAARIVDFRTKHPEGSLQPANLDQPFTVVTVPSPGAVEDAAGNLMPASYMNFYIANTTVVVPTYGVPADDAAVSAIAAMFPTRRAVAVDGKAVVVGGGAFHCSTQQQPRAPAAGTRP